MKPTEENINALVALFHKDDPKVQSVNVFRDSEEDVKNGIRFCRDPYFRRMYSKIT